MSDRAMHPGLKTQCAESHILPLTLFGVGGAVAPTVVEGDPLQYLVTVARTGVGVYTVKTNDPYVGCLGAPAPGCHVAAGAAARFVDVAYVQNADNTWTYTLSMFSQAGTAVELAANDTVAVQLLLRNTLVIP